MYKHSKLAPRLSGQNRKFFKLLFVSKLLFVAFVSLDTKKTATTDIEVCPESLGAMLAGLCNDYSMSPSWIWSDKITNERVPRVGYNHFISNKGEWNNCFSKFSNRVLPPIFISTILQTVRKENLAHYFPCDVKLRLLAHSRNFLANQKARNAIVGAENLLMIYRTCVAYLYLQAWLLTAMGLLYFFETTIEFRDINPKHLFKTWSDIVEAFIQYPMTNTGVEIKQFWKVGLKCSRVYWSWLICHPTVAADTRQSSGHGSLKVAGSTIYL